MPQHQKQKEGAATDACNTVQLLYSHHRTLCSIERQSTREVVGNVVAQQIRINSRAYRIDNTVADEARYGQSHEEELFREFMELIEDHYLEWHEVSDYADAMNITRKYLGLIVAKKTELTPKRLIDEYIVLQLKLRLRSQTMTMKQIAAQFHFTDMSFFSRYFRAHTGMTPAQWAKRQ